MTRDDIIKMAQEAWGNSDPSVGSPAWVYVMERFAALVAAAEREECAKVCDDKAKETFSGQCQVWGDYFARVIRARGNT